MRRGIYYKYLAGAALVAPHLYMINIETNRYDAFPGATVATFLFSLYLPSVDCNKCTNRITLLIYACIVAIIVVRCLELIAK